MQVDFFKHDRLALNRSSLVRNTNSLVQHFRDRHWDIIWVTTEFSPDLSDAFLQIRNWSDGPVIKGTPGAAILPELDHSESDTALIKKRYSAFFGTDLDTLLNAKRPDFLVVAGVNTHACVRTTVVDAYQRDFRVILASDCVDSHDEEHHLITMRYLEGKMAIKTSAEISQVEN